MAAKSAKKMFESPVPLSPEEFWLAIHQSLRKEASKNWRFHFPLAISENLQSFVVLQTLYTATPPKSGGQVTIKSTSMRLETVLGLKPTWWELQKQPPEFRSTVERGGPNNTGTYYTYKMTFHPDGHLIYFTDFHQLQQSTLAVLQISDTGFATLRKCQGSPDWDGDKVVFHPTHPIVFIYRDRVVHVWEYMDSPDLSTFYNPRCGYHGLQEMNVSSCGNFLVMSFPGKRPIIQSIAPYVTSDQKSQSSDVVTSPNQKEVQTLSAAGHLSLVSAGQVLKKLDVEICENGSHSSLGVRKSTTSIEINQWSQNEAGTMKRRQRLTMLPRWPTMEDTGVAVRWPFEKEQMVKIVMNQSSKKYYSHATAEIVEAGPILIQRDTRALQVPTGAGTVLESSDSANKSKGTSVLSDIWNDAAERKLKQWEPPDELDLDRMRDVGGSA